MKPNFYSIPYQADSKPILNRLMGYQHLAALESCNPTHPNGRWSIIVADPVDWVVIAEQDDTQRTESCISEFMQRLPSVNSPLPFTGGAIGLLSYEHGESHISPNQSTQSNEDPFAVIGFYTWAFLFDHIKQSGHLVHWPQFKGIDVKALLQIANNSNHDFSCDTFVITQPIKPCWSKREYLQRFDAVKRYIKQGDCYQINLTQAFKGKYKGASIDAYDKIKNTAKAPYSTYFDLGDQQLVSASPELFIEFDKDSATTKPIKGTRPRSANKTQDEQYKSELLGSKKDRAENVMIVDLLRNDLSKHGKHIEVSKLCEIESFETVHHLVSTITATIKPNDHIRVLLDAFPGGSITGAPKTRAMEIISELEGFPRRFYCGSCFVVSSNNKTLSNILIRSFIFDQDEKSVTCWAGGGIVADSDGEEEYQESLDKISRLIQAIS